MEKREKVVVSHGLLGLLVAVFLVAVGVFGYQYFTKDKTSAESTDKTEISSESSDQANGWNKYQNNDYGFSFNYPLGFFVNEKNKDKDGEFLVKISNKNTNEDFTKENTPIDYQLVYIREYSKNSLSDQSLIIKKANIGQIEVYDLRNSEDPTGGLYQKFASFVVSGKKFEIGMGTEKSSELMAKQIELFDIIVPTFSLENSTVLNWKTFQNSEYSIKYPTEWILYNNELAGMIVWYKDKDQKNSQIGGNFEVAISVSDAVLSPEEAAQMRKTSAEKEDEKFTVEISKENLGTINAFKVVTKYADKLADQNDNLYIFQKNNLLFFVSPSKIDQTTLAQMLESVIVK